jgi:hypothetical protein
MAYEILGAVMARRPAGHPSISIQPAGSIRINKEAAEILQGLGAERLLVMWDQAKRKIALAPSPSSDTRSYKLRYYAGHNGAQIAVKAIMSRIGWNAEHSVRIRVHLADNLLEGTVPSEFLNSPRKGRARTRKKKPDL